MKYPRKFIDYCKYDGFVLACMSLWDDITYPFYRVCRQIKTIFAYLPILWKDRDWDYEFFLEMMRLKLSRMERAFRKGCCTNSEQNADEMKLAIMIIDRILKDEYWDKANATFPYWKNASKTYEHEEYLVQQDYDHLFDLLKKRVRRWWD